MANPGYSRYMLSAAWRRRRARAIKRADSRCEFVDKDGKRCWAYSKLHCHHKNYQNFGHEKQADLQILCEDHHAVAELMKMMRGMLLAFTDYASAMAFWKIYKRKYPKDWVAALEAAKAAIRNDKGRTTGEHD
jgi:hypothetical protein